MPGLQGVVDIPAVVGVDPGEVEGVGVVADTDVGLRGREDQKVRDVHQTDGQEVSAAVCRLEGPVSGPSLAGLLPPP